VHTVSPAEWSNATSVCFLQSGQKESLISPGRRLPPSPSSRSGLRRCGGDLGGGGRGRKRPRRGGGEGGRERERRGARRGVGEGGEKADGGRGSFGLGFYEFGESFVFGLRRFLFGSSSVGGWCCAVAYGRACGAAAVCLGVGMDITGRAARVSEPGR
jgi:hypothetical protein